MRAIIAAALVAVAVLIAGCERGGATNSRRAASTTETTTALASIAEQSFPSQGNDHLAGLNEQHPPYNSDPPTSGWHLPPIPRPGIYTQPKQAEELPHLMEHGGLWLLYNCPDGCPDDVKALTDMVNKAINQNRAVALAPYPSMKARFAAVSWQYLLTLDRLDAAALSAFITRHACEYNPEGGPYCQDMHGQIGPTTGTPTPRASPGR